jgi:hypothetical protein
MFQVCNMFAACVLGQALKRETYYGALVVMYEIYSLLRLGIMHLTGADACNHVRLCVSVSFSCMKIDQVESMNRRAHAVVCAKYMGCLHVADSTSAVSPGPGSFEGCAFW